MDNNRCNLCPHACNIDRKKTSAQADGALGFCRMAQAPVVARAALHFGEEPCLSRPNGSGTVFFSGCTLKCRFCQNQKISHGNWGVEISAQRLGDIFLSLQEQGAQNLNLVSGTQFTPAIIEALRLADPSIPVVWNSGGYESLSTIEMLDGFVQVYLPDFKYAGKELSKRLSGAFDYAEAALCAIRAMADQVGKVRLDEKGRMTRGVMVRHLILPGHVDNTLQAIDALSNAFNRDEIWISLLSQYTPLGHCEGFPELNRRLTKWEIKKAQRALFDKGWTNGYVQDKSAATTKDIPDFDGTGVLK